MPLASAQTDKVKTSMAALKAETGKLGAPKVEVNNPYFGKTKVSGRCCREGARRRRQVVRKERKEFVRAAATVKKEDGASAVGTSLGANSSAMGSLNRAPCKRAC